MKFLSKSLLSLALLALVAAPVRAQAPGIDLRLNPRIGLHEPLSDLADAELAGETIAAELEGGLAVGLGAELQLAALPFGIRANLDYATGSEVRYVAGDLETETGVETTVLAVAGDLVFRPLPRIVLVSPYLFVGGGLKQYDFSYESGSFETFRDESDGTFHIGGGLDLGVGPIALNAEVGDYISSFDADGELDSEIQHDLFVTVGFSIGLL